MNGLIQHQSNIPSNVAQLNKGKTQNFLLNGKDSSNIMNGLVTGKVEKQSGAIAFKSFKNIQLSNIRAYQSYTENIYDLGLGIDAYVYMTTVLNHVILCPIFDLTTDSRMAGFTIRTRAGSGYTTYRAAITRVEYSNGPSGVSFYCDAAGTTLFNSIQIGTIEIT